MTDDQEWTTLALRLPSWMAEVVRCEAEQADRTVSDLVTAALVAGLPIVAPDPPALLTSGLPEEPK